MMKEPIIRLEVEALGERLTAMLANHAEQCNGLIRAGIERALEDMDIAAIAAVTAEPAIRKAIEAAVENYFTYGDGRIALDKLVMDVMRRPADEQQEDGDG